MARRGKKLCRRRKSSFFFNDTATTEIYTLSLHDALPICPEDDIAIINGAGMVKTLELARALTYTFAEDKIELVYKESSSGHQKDPKSSRRVSMGTIPDFSQPDSLSGFRLQGVTPEAPAERAGLQAMDIIIAIDDILIDNIYDLTYALGKYEPGDEVTIHYRRGDEEFSTLLTFAEASGRRHGGG